jgi:hypothetical protein
MSQYEDALSKYFMQEENFIAAYEISALFPKIKKELVEKFWRKVKELIEEKLKSLPEDENYKEWEVKISDNVYYTYSSLFIQKKDNFNIVVRFECLWGSTYYGLWIHHGNKGLDRKSINEHAAKIEAIKDMKKTQWYLGHNDMNENFEDIETLKKILRPKMLAENWADILFNLWKDTKEDISEMLGTNK